MAGNKIYRKVERCFNAGEVIFRQGDPCDGIYSVKVGAVSVYKTTPTATGPADVELVRLGPGSMFGEMGMLDQTRRDASVKAVDYTECIVITREMAALPAWVVNFIKILVGRLRNTNDRLTAALQILEAHGLAPAEAGAGTQAQEAAPADAPASPAPQGNPKPPPANS
jgi:CRP-like cAMP-binding protein